MGSVLDPGSLFLEAVDAPCSPSKRAPDSGRCLGVHQRICVVFGFAGCLLSQRHPDSGLLGASSASAAVRNTRGGFWQGMVLSFWAILVMSDKVSINNM